MMLSLLRRFVRMPRSTRIALGVVSGGGVSYLAWHVFGSTGVLFLLLGTIIVGLIVAFYMWLVKKAKKRKAARFGQDMKDAGASTPQGISQAEQIAKIDDLRRRFEEGTAKFRAAGKDVYSLPWYVVVGEPGSGKTEAVRHSNIGFPPGLHDELQGVGGTINMNWWFTNSAVLLDLAGRLIFEDVDAATSSEWKEFLTLLNTHRPNCPINGLLLVLPADSLIKDSAEEIQAKGAKIAQQLDVIQRTLDIRFPVFVMVTKSDLINGFREFFDDLDSPEQQHQMLGWSNPLSIDDAFNPEMLDKHMADVTDCLLRRRLTLLQNPTPVQDLSRRRIDEVDTLYNLPESFTRIVGPLKRYLGIIFAASEWSAKPLFLRGVYFTSSMREGAALDGELADALGVPMESLPEGRVWERDRAFFLRDTFVKKAFAEWGLVTRASNVKQEHMRRRLMVMGAGFASVLLLLGFSFFGARALKRSIGKERDMWVAAADASSLKVGEESDALPIVKPAETKGAGYVYNGNAQVRVAMSKVPLAEFHHELAELVKEPIRTPLVFRIARPFDPGLTQQRRHGQRLFFEISVIGPLVRAAREKMAVDTVKTWSPDASAALGELIRIEADALGRRYDEADAVEERIDLRALFRYVLSDDEYGAYDAEAGLRMEDALAVSNLGRDKKDGWPATWLTLGPRLKTNEPVKTGVDSFLGYCASPPELQSLERQLDLVQLLWSKLDVFSRETEKAYLVSEDGFLRFFKGNMRKMEVLKGFEEVERDWKNEYETLGEAITPVRASHTEMDGLYRQIIICQKEDVAGAYATAISNVLIQSEQLLDALPLPIAEVDGESAKKQDDEPAPDPYLPEEVVALIEKNRADLKAKIGQKNVVQQLLDFKKQYGVFAERTDKCFGRFAAYKPVIIPEKVRNRKGPWAEYHKKFGTTDVASQNESLENVCKRIFETFSTLQENGAALPAEGLKTVSDRASRGLARIESRSFKRICQDAIENWARLTGRALGDRDAIMAMTVKTFSKGYVISVPPEETDFVAQYWEDFIASGLASHADETIIEVHKLVPKLKGYARFPLARPKAGAVDLSAAEIVEVAALMDKVRPLQAVEEAKTLGEGGAVGVPRLDEQMERLRSLDLGDRVKWILAAKEMLAALPTDAGRKHTCKVYLLTNKEQQRLLDSYGKGDIRDYGACIVWTIAELKAAGMRAAKHRVVQAKPTQIGRIAYPGDGFEFLLYKYHGDAKPSRALSFKKAWDCLRILHQFPTERVKDDPTKWNVQLALKDDSDRERLLWVQFEFEGKLPDLKQWPDAGDL